MCFGKSDWFLAYSVLLGIFFIIISSRISSNAKDEKIALSILTIIIICAFLLLIGLYSEVGEINKINNVDWTKAGMMLAFFLFSACISIFYSIIFEPSGQRLGEFSGYFLWFLAVVAQIITTFEYVFADMVWRPGISGLVSTLFGTLGTTLLVNVYLIKKNKKVCNEKQN